MSTDRFACDRYWLSHHAYEPSAMLGHSSSRILTGGRPVKVIVRIFGACWVMVSSCVPDESVRRRREVNAGSSRPASACSVVGLVDRRHPDIPPLGDQRESRLVLPLDGDLRAGDPGGAP